MQTKSRPRWKDRAYDPRSQGFAAAISIVLLAAVAATDFLTGKDTSFTLLYLAPIAIAVWWAGNRTALVVAVLATVVSFVVEYFEEPLLARVVADSGVRLGVYLTFATLLNYLKNQHRGGEGFFRRHRLVMVGVGLACILAIGAGVVERRTSVKASPGHNSADLFPGGDSTHTLADLAALLDESLRASRPVLLGSRDPDGKSCVTVTRTGEVNDDVPNPRGDWNGGCGTSLAMIYYFDRKDCKSAEQDFDWHQNRLRRFLENESVLNRPAAELAGELAKRTRELWENAAGWTSLPGALQPVEYSRNSDWPSYCFNEMNKALAARDLHGVQHWSGELAAAAFSLDDLHRWLSFLVENHLTALDFQLQCGTLFSAKVPADRKYDPFSTLSQYPAGILGLNGAGNYYEVERQAERLFSMPSDQFAEIDNDQHLTSASLWVPPDVRESFLKLQEVLSPENQKVWEAAARTPYHHSYLVNMLFRTGTVDASDELRQVLKKYDTLNPHASMGPLLGVLMYRGHSFAGLEWGDRYQPELMQAAETISNVETDLQALQDACRWTNHFYQSPARYGVIFTLRGALEQGKLDCVRATDMIGAIFRNAGRSRFGHVRWCSETGGHSVAAYLGTENGKLKAELVDGLSSSNERELWPDCYFHGHAWPPGLENNAQPYAVELYIRGLDSYIWAEGYIVRGPNAGSMTVAAIPYSTHHQERSTRKVFEGPYPE